MYTFIKTSNYRCTLPLHYMCTLPFHYILQNSINRRLLKVLCQSGSAYSVPDCKLWAAESASVVGSRRCKVSTRTGTTQGSKDYKVSRTCQVQNREIPASRVRSRCPGRSTGCRGCQSCTGTRWSRRVGNCRTPGGSPCWAALSDYWKPFHLFSFQTAWT